MEVLEREEARTKLPSAHSCLGSVVMSLKILLPWQTHSALAGASVRPDLNRDFFVVAFPFEPRTAVDEYLRSLGYYLL